MRRSVIQYWSSIGRNDIELSTHSVQRKDFLHLLLSSCPREDTCLVLVCLITSLIGLETHTCHGDSTEAHSVRQPELVSCREETEIRLQHQQQVYHCRSGQQCSEWGSGSIGMRISLLQVQPPMLNRRHESRLMGELDRSCEQVGCRRQSWNSLVCPSRIVQSPD